MAVVPVADTVNGLSGSLFDIYLAPYFREAYRPIGENDTFTIKGTSGRVVEFYVVELDPRNYGVVAQDTVIFCDGKPIERSKLENEGRGTDFANIDFEDIGACQDIVKQVQKWIVWPLEHPDLSLGSALPSRLLIVGLYFSSLFVAAYGMADN
jgi:transitional endoplasmic reticulum ATPase